MTARRIAIVGCRPPASVAPEALKLYQLILGEVGLFVSGLPSGTVVVSGGADGVDAHAASRARHFHLSTAEHLPDYATHGRRAPLERNKLIVADCDELHAWPAPWSRGTWHTVRLAREAGKPTFVHEPWRRSEEVGGV